MKQRKSASMTYFLRRTPNMQNPLAKNAEDGTSALRARITKNTDWSTGPLARPFARLLTPLTHLLAPHCSALLRTALARFARALRCAHLLTRSLLRSWESEWLDGYLFCVFFVLAHSATAAAVAGSTRNVDVVTATLHDGRHSNRHIHGHRHQSGQIIQNPRGTDATLQIASCWDLRAKHISFFYCSSLVSGSP